MARIPFLSCFLPAWNESENLVPLLEECAEVLARVADRFEVIVVDDGSTDATADVVRQFAARVPQVRVESHPRNLGYGEALLTGLRASAGDVVFFTDADRQFRIADIGLLIGPLADADLVVGYRLGRKDPWHRRAISATYHQLLRWLFHIRFRDVHCAFKLLSRDVVDEILPLVESRSAFVSTELLVRADLAGARVVEVGVPHHPRVAGTPKGARPSAVVRTMAEMVGMRTRLRPAQPQPQR